MTLKINYWSCPFADYEEDYDNRYYGCKLQGTCGLDNKWFGDEEDCEFIKEDEDGEIVEDGSIQSSG